MKRLLFIFLILGLFASSLKADPWQKTDKILQYRRATLSGVNVLKWSIVGRAFSIGVRF